MLTDVILHLICIPGHTLAEQFSSLFSSCLFFCYWKTFCQEFCWGFLFGLMPSMPLLLWCDSGYGTMPSCISVFCLTLFQCPWLHPTFIKVTVLISLDWVMHAYPLNSHRTIYLAIHLLQFLLPTHHTTFQLSGNCEVGAHFFLTRDLQKKKKHLQNKKTKCLLTVVLLCWLHVDSFQIKCLLLTSLTILNPSILNILTGLLLTNQANTPHVLK